MDDRNIPKLPRWGAAFWISPARQAVQVKTSHIAMVCTYPLRFGLEKAQVEEVYSRHGDDWCSEGNAREEIIRCLVGRGWTRVRHYKNTGWTVNAGQDKPLERNTVGHFFKFLLLKNPQIEHDKVRFDHPAGEAMLSVSALISEFIGSDPDAGGEHTQRVTFVREPNELGELKN
jgi:hypothetical protein